MNRKLGKQTILLILTFVLSIVTSCDNAGRNQESHNPVVTGSSEPLHATIEPNNWANGDQPIVLGFSQLGSESDWRRANSRSIQEAAEEAGIKLLFENAEQSQEKQFEAIRSFIEQKVDVIAFSPVIESGWEPILQEAKIAGIPIVLADRAVKVEDPSLYVTTIGADFYEEGMKAGKYLLDKLRDEPGPINIVELQGTEGSSPTIERGNGFRDVIQVRKDLVIQRAEPADFTVEQGKAIMRSYLQEMGSEIRVLYAHNDDMAIGAIEAIEEYGLQPGKDIVIISVDGTRKAFELMVEGKINCIVECNPLFGPIIMQAVREIMDGRNLPKRIVPQESVFTEDAAKKEAPNRQY
ncbi:ABC transporter substrate-binding protein [Paenibacillus sp. LHD-117]|uniref:ABC transporter substrate-binding protein n=1 Tax=Paenibacillus sp. LHD-117 TaxID=3071412 RepID=UPI0027DF32FD|nr:ABC transporter substrate-binding protein [Paenibacillus sp. LHD-117]MDQ6417844.1 ABC transporter substrate-binding protein [Paenibacillus sp. LHD-117]